MGIKSASGVFCVRTCGALNQSLRLIWHRSETSAQFLACCGQGNSLYSRRKIKGFQLQHQYRANYMSKNDVIWISFSIKTVFDGYFI